MTANDYADLRAEALAALDAAWTELSDGADRDGDARLSAALSDGRVLLVGLSRKPRQRAGPAAAGRADAGAARDARLAHDVNNALGGMLAHLHLALADLEAGHPARPWIEAANGSASALRERLRQAREARGAAGSGGRDRS